MGSPVDHVRRQRRDFEGISEQEHPAKRQSSQQRLARLHPLTDIRCGHRPEHLRVVVRKVICIGLAVVDRECGI